MTYAGLDIGIRANSSAPDRSLMAALALAARSASHALNAARPESQALLATLETFAAKVHGLHMPLPSGCDESIGAVLQTFTTQYDALRDTLDDQTGRAASELSRAFADLERNAASVTIMLFGRTRAGKSTTMEALTGGDGASIGVGRQHTTTDVRAYHYPRAPNGAAPGGLSLRIVDTPGIEGFEGDALAEMAEKYIEQSDHILFLLTDDKAGADELKRFQTIRAQGKSVTILLNVKAGDDDLDLLITNPELIFRESEIDGHTRRICRFLEENFDIPAPRVIPIHARAAWLSTGRANIADHRHDQAMLRKRSRLSDLEHWIEDFIRHEASLARLRAPKDLLLGYIMRQKDTLRPVAGEFRTVMADLETLSHRLRDGTARARARAVQRLPILRARFQAAADAAEGMIDEVTATGGRGAELDTQWQTLLQRHGVRDGFKWFTTAAQQDFRDEIEANVQAVAFDYKFANADNLGGLLGHYYNAQGDDRRNKYARAGIKTAGGLGGGVLAAWAVANFWNPTGWGAAAAALVVAVAGIAGEEITRKATNEWERSSRNDMREKRDGIVAQLRVQLWEDHEKIRARCVAWLDSVAGGQTLMIDEVARPVRDSSWRLWQATVDTLNALDEIADRLNESLVHDLFTAIVPECRQGDVRLTGISRETGYRTKITVSAFADVNAVAACVGRQGSRIRRVSEALGHEKIDLVDANEGLERQVLQALGLRGDDVAAIWASAREGQALVYVRPASPKLIRAAVGPRGANVRLAKKLLGIDIVIVER
jgi:transcription antitermination factor NusA-like protein/GTP-binding protein EngB required for normal cell division